MIRHQQSLTWNDFDTTSIERGSNPRPSDRETSTLLHRPQLSPCCLKTTTHFKRGQNELKILLWLPKFYITDSLFTKLSCYTLFFSHWVAFWRAYLVYKKQGKLVKKYHNAEKCIYKWNVKNMQHTIFCEGWLQSIMHYL